MNHILKEWCWCHPRVIPLDADGAELPVCPECKGRKWLRALAPVEIKGELLRCGTCDGTGLARTTRFTNGGEA